MSNQTVNALTKTYMNRTFRIVSELGTGLDVGNEYQIRVCTGLDIDGEPLFTVVENGWARLLLGWLLDEAITVEVK